MSARIRAARPAVALVLAPGFLALLAASPPQDADARAIEAPVRAVTVYPEGATVVRRTSLPAGGAFVVQGLPGALDLDSLRVRARGGEVVAVEPRPRTAEPARVPEGRLAELRASVRQRREELRALQLEHEARVDARLHVDVLVARLVEEQRADVEAATVAVEVWDARLEWLHARLAGALARVREVEERRARVQEELSAVELELERSSASEGVPVIDVAVDVVALGAGSEPLELELEVFVPQAGWSPVYDVRVAPDLASAELVHDALVWQRSGDDWTDVELVLSTAEPRRGTRAPEPRVRWVGLDDTRQGVSGSQGIALDAVDAEASVAAPARASVSDEGLSVRLTLLQRESVESRSEPTRMRVGRDRLTLIPERYCLPAEDATVWLRGRARNTTPWTLFRGETAIFMGADFVGRGALETTRVGQEFELALGSDPALSVESIVVVDRDVAPGAFSRRRTWRRDRRLRVANHGAAGAAVDGSVQVAVHAVLPRSTDERIRVSLERAEPEPSDAERWVTLREEQGLLTWDLRVERGRSEEVRLSLEVEYPRDEQLIVLPWR